MPSYGVEAQLTHCDCIKKKGQKACNISPAETTFSKLQRKFFCVKIRFQHNIREKKMPKIFILILLLATIRVASAQENHNIKYHNTADSITAIPVAAQLAAYNARNIEEFAKCFAEDIELKHFESGETFLTGKEAFIERYAGMFAEKTELHCHIASRIVIGNKVIDEELVSGLGEGIVHAVAIYTVESGIITEVAFIME